MTTSGTWIAKSSTKSTSPRTFISSMSATLKARTRGSSSLALRGVKPRLMSLRWRVCSGSSIETIDIGASSLGRTPKRAQ